MRFVNKVKSTITLELTPLVLTKEQVAGMLQVTVDTIDNLHRTKQLVAVKCGKHRRWRLKDVTYYVEHLEPGGNA